MINASHIRHNKLSSFLLLHTIPTYIFLLYVHMQFIKILSNFYKLNCIINMTNFLAVLLLY